MTSSQEGTEAWQVELGVALVPAAILLETGADFHMPWWGVVLVAVVVGALTHRHLLALRHNGPAMFMAIAFGTGYWLVWEVACWLGENGAEWLHRGWRWWVVAVILSAGFRAWEASTPRDA